MRAESRSLPRVSGLWAVVLLAFLFRAFIAPGYMPVATAHGVDIVICSADGAVTRTVNSTDGRGDAPSPDVPHHAKQPCPYALSATLLAPEPPVSPRPVARPVPQPSVLPAPEASPRSSPALPPPATGPPLLL